MVTILVDALWLTLTVVAIIIICFALAAWVLGRSTKHHQIEPRTYHVSSIRPPVDQPTRPLASQVHTKEIFNEDHPAWPHYRDNYKTRH